MLKNIGLSAQGRAEHLASWLKSNLLQEMQRAEKSACKGAKSAEKTIVEDYSYNNVEEETGKSSEEETTAAAAAAETPEIHGVLVELQAWNSGLNSDEHWSRSNWKEDCLYGQTKQSAFDGSSWLSVP